MDAITPLWIAESDVAGLDISALKDAVGFGIYVLAGANNSGKTLTLKALHGCRFGAAVSLSMLSPMQWERADLRAKAAQNAKPFRITWPRDFQGFAQGAAYSDVPKGFQIDESNEKYMRATYGFREEHVKHLCAEVWSRVQKRPAALVPTNRYFDASATLASGSELSDLRQWAVYLQNLESDPTRAKRDQFLAIQEAFRDITEGLDLRIRRPEARTADLCVSERGATSRDEYPLSACGDGLRDLIGVILFAVCFPEKDLLLDEPGLRLHPRTQRRLLGFLERSARTRSVWIASHDGVFIGAPGAQSRFFVRRDATKELSIVETIADRDSGRAALSELGWVPGDAFLADRVLLCEGPSDRIAFEAVRTWLEEEDPTWGGLIVAEMDGDGAVAGETEAVKRIELARSVSPHASVVVLLDSALRTKEQREAMERTCRNAGAELKCLQRPELENYFLNPDVVCEVFVECVRRAESERNETFSVLRSEDVKARLESGNNGTTKGSEILEAIWKTVPMPLQKREVAQLAVSRIREKKSAADDANAMKEEIRKAFPKRDP